MDTKALRQKILDLAIRGKLVPQDPNDEPASVLLERIRTEKERLIAEGKIKRPKKAKASSSESHYRNDFQPPFPIPDSWEWVTIGDISSSILYGVSESAKDNGQYKLLRITDIQNNQVNWRTVPSTDFPPGKVVPYILHKGDILFARTGATVGKSYLVNQCPPNTIYASYLIRIQTFQNIEPAYLKFFFESGFYWQQISEGSVGIGQPNVNGTSLSLLKIPIPPKSEQMRIVGAIQNVLSTVDSIEAGKQSTLTSVNQAKSKILELAMQGKLVPQDPSDEPAADMLRRVNPKARIITDNPHYPQLPDNWVLTTIGSVCNYGSCINIPVEDIPENGWVLELEDIEKDSGKVIDKLPKKTRQINGVRHRFKSGDVLYSKLRTYLNKVFIADEDGFCTPEIIPIKSGEMMDSEFLCLWLRSPYFLAYTASCGYGVKMPRLSTQDARKGIVPLPPLEDQKRIVKAIKDTYVLMENIVNQIN